MTGPAGAPLLRVEGASKSFRGVAAVTDAHVRVDIGAIHGMIGPNGAGKTTLVNIISGYARPDRGKVLWGERDITRLRPERRARLGMVRTFQDTRLLEDLSVRDNLWLGTLLRASIHAADTDQHEPPADEQQALLTLLGLEDRLDSVVRDLSSGERKAVEVGRALTAGATLLLLDEPFSGLTRIEVDRMLMTLREIRDSGVCSILLVEHNLGAVFELCDHVTAMDKGAVVISGSADEVKSSIEVKRAFFGAESIELDAGSTPAPFEESTAIEPIAPGEHSALAVRDLQAGYGHLAVIHGVNLEVQPGEIVALIGANGAGKTTIFRSIMGLANIYRGEIVIAGEVLTRVRADVVVGSRVSFCTQSRNLFISLTVEENLRLGARAVSDGSNSATRTRVAEVLEMLPALAPFARKSAGALSGGQQQLLAIGRALMSSPRVLLLDEPSTGLAVGALRTLAESLHQMAAGGLAVIVAEQNVSFATSVCSRGYVIESGRVAAEGSHDVLARAWEVTVAESDGAAETLSAEQLVRIGGQPEPGLAAQ